jgi:hypothetical protein
MPVLSKPIVRFTSNGVLGDDFSISKTKKSLEIVE